MTAVRVAGWPVMRGRGQRGRARALHGKLLRWPRLRASTGGILVSVKFTCWLVGLIFGEPFYGERL